MFLSSYSNTCESLGEREINLFTSTIKMQILFARAIITSTAHASSVFLSSYKNTVLNQSVHVFALGCFLTTIKVAVSSCVGLVCSGNDL